MSVAHGQQQMLTNGSFETPVVTGVGNHFYATISGWAVKDLSNPLTQPFNVILPGAGYANNPGATPSGGGSQYLDINSSSGTITQSFTVTATGMISISGSFSVRDFRQNLSGNQIQVRDGAGTVIANASVSFSASEAIGTWKSAAINFIPVQPGTYTFEAIIPDYANFDIASVIYMPALTITKSSTAYWDPVNAFTNPKRIPGALVTYSINVSSPSDYTVSSNTLAVSDATPANMALIVSDFAGGGGGPVQFSAGSSGLSYGFTSLASQSDSVDFSNDNGATWSYQPVAGADGSDPAVTTVRVRPGGSMAANSSFSVNLRYKVR